MPMLCAGCGEGHEKVRVWPGVIPAHSEHCGLFCLNQRPRDPEARWAGLELAVARQNGGRGGVASLS